MHTVSQSLSHNIELALLTTARHGTARRTSAMHRHFDPLHRGMQIQTRTHSCHTTGPLCVCVLFPRSLCRLCFVFSTPTWSLCLSLMSSHSCLPVKRLRLRGRRCRQSPVESDEFSSQPLCRGVGRSLSRRGRIRAFHRTTATRA